MNEIKRWTPTFTSLRFHATVADADKSSLHELWALFHFLYPDVFIAQTSDAFKEAFNLTKGTYNTTFIDRASALLGKMMLRRMKVDIEEIKLPPKEELLVYV